MKLRIHVLYEHSLDGRKHGSSYIRSLLPLAYTPNPDSFVVTEGLTYVSADILIVERTWKWAEASLTGTEELVDRARRDGARLIYSIDDNLLDLRLGGLGGGPLPQDQLMLVRYFLREADGVIVSTEPLRDRIQKLSKRIVVVPNALDDRLWQTIPPKANGRTGQKVIGFMGTFTHDADLMMILQPLREILRRYRGGVELQLIGGIREPTFVRLLPGLPITILQPPEADYPDFVRWITRTVNWDLAIAPLEDNSFTRCKSDIKFLDYSALGIAGIYSRVPAYQSTVRHLETGYVAENDPGTWLEALDRLLTDGELRRRIAAASQEYVFSRRTLRHRAEDWRNAILTIVDT